MRGDLKEGRIRAMHIFRGSIPGRGNSKGQSLQAGPCVFGMFQEQGGSVVGVEGERGNIVEARPERCVSRGRAQITQAPIGHEGFVFYPEGNGRPQNLAKSKAGRQGQWLEG